MPYAIIIGSILFVAVLAVGALAAPAKNVGEIDLDAMVEAIRQVENWDGRSHGAAGERGPWQITPAVWKECSDQPFSWADSPYPAQKSESRRVAREWLYRIQRRLEAARHGATPYNVALVYGAGWNAFFYQHPGKPSRAKRDYADRARNLYEDLLKTARPFRY